jgi:protein arginine N-methyltransferase 1
MTPDPAAVKLRLAPDVRVICLSGGEFGIQLGPLRIVGGPYTLAILVAFRTPCTLVDALNTIQGQVTETLDWIGLSAQLASMQRAGMLIDEAPAQTSATPLNGTWEFGAAPVHIGMLNDRERTRRFLSAISASVRPGDVVVDLGTGSGVMAVAAAKAGAARVYAIEASGIAHVARRVFAANGVADRNTLIEGHSTQITLPERADLLVAELIGNEPLAERILECTADAVDRFLKPGARLIPHRLVVFAVPVELPSVFRDRYLASPETIAHWHHEYGIDFSALADLARSAPATFQESQMMVSQWTALAEPEMISDFDLADSLPAAQHTDARFTATRDGLIHAFVLWFRAELSKDNELSTDPRMPRIDNCWGHPVYLLPEPAVVRIGDQIQMRLEGSSPRIVQVAVNSDLP